MTENKLKNYVVNYLAADFNEVCARGHVVPPIDEFESTIIYKYTKDGYIDLNKELRNKRNDKLPEFGKYLKHSLEKLPSYKGLAYRGVNLTASQTNLYQKFYKSGEPLTEPAFLSTSRRRTLAMSFGTKCLFVIHSKHGKLVENYARFGINNPHNESEVIFSNNSTFTVADISREGNRIVITMFEV
ncbi:MAG: ADP-ribosyltransferase [Bacteroidota bacterium]